MVTIMPAAPLDGAAVLPDLLIDQYVKPGDGQSALLAALRLTALGWIEGHTRRSLKRRTWTATFDGFGDGMRLPCDPVRAVTAVSYVDASGVTMNGAGLWQLVGPAFLPATGQRWPATVSRTGSVTVTFDAGYDDVGTEAPALQIAALMLVRHLFDGGSLDDVPATVSLLLDAQYRTPVIA